MGSGIDDTGLCDDRDGEAALQDGPEVRFAWPEHGIVITDIVAQFAHVTLPVSSIEALQVETRVDGEAMPDMPGWLPLWGAILAGAAVIPGSPMVQDWSIWGKLLGGLCLAGAAAWAARAVIVTVWRRYVDRPHVQTLIVVTGKAGAQAVLETGDKDVFQAVRDGLTQVMSDAKRPCSSL